MDKLTAAALYAALSTAAMSGSALACSETTPCGAEGGEYYIALPAPSDTPPPAILY